MYHNHAYSAAKGTELPKATHIEFPIEIADKAIEIFSTKYRMIKPLYSIGVRGINLVTEDSAYQQDLLTNHNMRDKFEKLERTVDEIRERFGYKSIQRGIILKNKEFTDISPKDDHVIHPVGYLSGKII